MLNVARKGEYIYEGISNPRLLTVNDGTRYLIKTFYNLVSIGLATGMRISELRGLSWDNVDFNNNVIRVRQQVIDLAKQGCIYAPLKTRRSKRTIIISSTVMNELADLKSYQQDYANNLGDMFNNEHNLVFTNTFGSPFSVNNFRRRYFNKMLASAKIPAGFTIHCMRHTHATLLLKNGVNVEVVSKRLGHAKVSITLDIYSHVLKPAENNAPDMWEVILKAPTNTESDTPT